MCVVCVVGVVCVVCFSDIRHNSASNRSYVEQYHTHGRVALNKENRFHMCLEPPGIFNKAKNTNVNEIGKT